MVGDRVAHPLLISLANIKMAYRMKSSHLAYLLLALLPVPKYIERDSKVRGVLEARLMHECLDHILAPLKIAAQLGVMLTDPYGFIRCCFTPLASYIVDTPEAAMIAVVSGKTSHLTMATHKQFGDAFRHEPRTASTTLAQLHALSSVVDPVSDIKAYLKAAKKFRLSRVHKPFWRDWAQAEPCRFLTLEMLHHLHKFLFDHDLKWCINVVGEDEIDFRFSVLHPRTGYRHFKEGVSKLKQVTGRQYRDIQRYLIGVIAGAAPKAFVLALRALQDFRYYLQAPIISERICGKIEAALKTFHDNKHAILEAGARTGKGNHPIDNWHIPKLELLQSAVAHIRDNGALIQWSADVTEHAHIEVVKDPVKAGNNQKHEEQICRTLDRRDKCQRFDLATSMKEAQRNLESSHHLDDAVDEPVSDAESDNGDSPSGDGEGTLLIFKRRRTRINYFHEAQCHAVELPTMSNSLPRTFASSSTAFHLSGKASFKLMTLEEASVKFALPDLIPALKYFEMWRRTNRNSLYAIGGHRMRCMACGLE